MACARFNGAGLVGPQAFHGPRVISVLLGPLKKQRTLASLGLAGCILGPTLWEEMTCTCSVASCSTALAH